MIMQSVDAIRGVILSLWGRVRPCDGYMDCLVGRPRRVTIHDAVFWYCEECEQAMRCDLDLVVQQKAAAREAQPADQAAARRKIQAPR